MDRPWVDNLLLRQLSLTESGSLTKPFTESEVKAAVWACDSYKSPGPDDINFGFYKDFRGTSGAMLCAISQTFIGTVN
jgi:hypothetical protein